MRQIKLLKVSFPILIFLVMVLSIAGWQLPIARADTCSESICYVRAGYVAHSDTTGTYDYVESTFTLPQEQDITIPDGTNNSKFSIGVVLGGDNHFNSQNWAAAGIDIQVTNGQIASQTSFWSVTDQATTDSRGLGSGHGYFPTNVKNVNLGDKIKASIGLNNSVVTFSMKDLSNSDTSTNQDRFSLPIDSGKEPDGQTAGCVVFFSNASQYPNFAYPQQVKFSTCKVGANRGSKQAIDSSTSFGYTAQALSQSASLDTPSSRGGFTVCWNGVDSNVNTGSTKILLQKKSGKRRFQTRRKRR